MIVAPAFFSQKSHVTARASTEAGGKRRVEMPDAMGAGAIRVATAAARGREAHGRAGVGVTLRLACGVWHCPA